MTKCLYKEVCVNKTCEYCRLKNHTELDKLAMTHLKREMIECNTATVEKPIMYLI